MKLIDANVILYAAGADHEYREPCRSVVTLAYRRQMAAAVNTGVLQEVLHYYHRHGRTDAALRAFDDTLIGLPEPCAIDRETAIIARDILATHPHLQTRDAFHAATVFQHNLEGIISADRAFDTIKGLTRFDPKELAA
jgi:predicted nucleic acid-binding protein